MIKRYDPRLIIGGLFILGGLLALLDVSGIISNAGGIFWGIIWGAISLFFLYLLFTDRTRNWWAAFPGFILLGVAISSILPDPLDAVGDLVALGGLSLAFWWVYFTDRSRWWAIIPAGVLLTAGVTSMLDDITGWDISGNYFLLGLGLTFILVTVLPSTGNRSWALIPGIILLLIGATTTFGLGSYVWPAALIVVGGYLVLVFFRRQAGE